MNLPIVSVPNAYADEAANVLVRPAPRDEATLCGRRGEVVCQRELLPNAVWLIHLEAQLWTQTLFDTSPFSPAFRAP